MSVLEARSLIWSNNRHTLHLVIDCPHNTSHQGLFNNGFSRPMTSKLSPEFQINQSLKFQIIAECFDLCGAPHYAKKAIMIFVKFIKSRDDNTNYEIEFSSPQLQFRKCYHNFDGTICQIYKDEEWKVQSFNVEVNWKIVHRQSSFESLYDDEDLVDFQLKAEDGSVQMHKAVLAASSPVLRRMLGGAWRETAEGCVEVPDVSKDTLQHLKDYIYLNKLPETGLQELLLLASLYMMTDLEEQATMKIVRNVTAMSACDILDFASTHKLRGLQVAILRKIQEGHIKVDQIQSKVKFEGNVKNTNS